jgi:hypothetical protein
MAVDMTSAEVVREWVVAANAVEVLRLMALSAGDIVLGKTGATSRGQPVLRQWVERGGLQMTTERCFSSGDRVVLVQQIIWRDRSGLTIAEARIAHRFVVSGERVSVAVRHDSLDEALAIAELTTADEIAHGA